jgi:hypothetical protein
MRRLIAVCALVLLTVILTVGITPNAQAFCGGDFNPFCAGHSEMTNDALSFLSPGIRDRVEESNLSQDEGDAFERPERHFQSCLFTKSTDYIRGQYDEMISALSPASESGVDSATATERWGRLFHPIQDFYSHSAWVDPVPGGLGFGTTHRPRLLDHWLGNWRRIEPYDRLFPNDDHHSDIVAVEGNIPPGFVSIDLPRDAEDNPTSAVPIVRPADGPELRGLMTSVSRSEPLEVPEPDENFSQCPPPSVVGADTCLDIDSICIRHGGDECRNALDLIGDNQIPIWNNCLQHDGDSRPYYDEAYRAALAQTRHEWCRLLHMLRNQKGYDAASVPLALWVNPGSSPHPPGTACSRPRTSSRSVLVTFEGAVLANSDANLSVVVYTGDFQRSVQRVSEDRSTISGSVKICVSSPDRIAITMWGWKDFPLVGDSGSFDPIEPVLKGGTQTVSGPFEGVTNGDWQSTDLRLEYAVSSAMPDSSCLSG